MRINENEKREVEVKKYAKIEKIPGGAIEDCRVLDGVLFSKDVVNPSRMKRVVRNPRILLLDCPVEYKKGENQTNVELLQETDFAELLKQEEEVICLSSPLHSISYAGCHRVSTRRASEDLLTVVL